MTRCGRDNTAKRAAGRLFAALGCALAAFAATPASAQPADDLFGLTGSRWQVGAAVFVTPKWEGSKSYEAIGFPFVAPASYGSGTDGTLQIKGIDDIRFRLINQSGFEAGPLVGYRLGRDASDSVRLTGLGDVEGGLVAGGYAGYRAGATFFYASYHHQVTGDETGGLLRLGVEQAIRLAPNTRLTATLATSYASQDYMTSFFGVSTAQAAASGLPVYRPDAGFKDVSAGLTAFLDIDRNWTLALTGRYSYLVGDAADSPIIETRNQFFGGVGLSYKFDIGR